MRAERAKISPRPAGAALLTAAAFIASSTPAHAAPEVLNGRYNVQYANSDKPTAWLFVPCGSDCTLATSQDGGTFVISWEFHLANGRWTHSGTAQAPCPNGASAPVTVNYSFDAVSLAGEGQTTTSDACSGEPPKTFTRQFQLSKA
ncbi:hypothetical protein AWC05_02290 [Mycobacterium florentinum]|uniref:Uncharacterized protein n=1 Tax=Mycobacterium florentinum TaxID=292462 RepID=A0A1X1TY78_MYCFL|nr:hypothetical protein [Mycobacterium florentinum]MCV7410771.1 hypothetical protein [Mycobacterium florentinum]ORV49526.1 hypothetical protein AWC05_02290 [Mycobacterium florentinum]BBX80102.1 hypothetical protein MFLOJ_38890 [Mycobacterium florentinum]